MITLLQKLIRLLFIGCICLVTINSFWACKPVLTEYIDDAALDIMTSGYWVVSSFSEGGTDITADFAGWEVRFNRDRTMQLSKAGSTSVAGTWSSNNLRVDFSASIPAAATSPLPKLGGSWLVINNSSAGTSFSKTVAGTSSILVLKQR